MVISRKSSNFVASNINRSIKNIQAAALMLFALFMASCESFYYTEEAENNSEKNVHINVTEIKQTAFNEDEKDVL